MSNERLVCPDCNFSCRSPATYADHLEQRQKEPAKQTSTMLTRRLADVTAKKKRKAFMLDLSGQHGTFPQPSSESVSVDDRINAIRAAVKELNELKLGRLPILVKSVRNALNTWRKRRKLYKLFPGIAVN